MTLTVKMVFLSDELLLGQGTKRRCYVYPDEPSLCIKITSERGKRSANREIRYLNRLRRRGVSMAQIGDFRGRVQTNLGLGELYQLVRDYDGRVSGSMRHYLRLGDDEVTETIVAAIEELRVYLVQNEILFSDLKVDNLLAKKGCDGSLRLVIIDGVGDNNQIPFLEYFQPLRVRQCMKKWDAFISDVAMWFPQVGKCIEPFVDYERY